MQDISNFFTSVAKPIIASADLQVEATLAGFQNAYGLVSSRAFVVDTYQGLSMVPIADA